MKTQTEKEAVSPAACILRGALLKLNECRARCPGRRGDVDAINLRHLIARGQFLAEDRKAIEQAGRTLDTMSRSLEIDAASEVAALRLLPVMLVAPELLNALERVLQFMENAVPDIHAENREFYGELARSVIATIK